MPSVGSRCHKLRIHDAQQSWRILYRVDPDAVVLIEVFSKKTGKTPKSAIDLCKKRLKDYDSEES
jgi:phage-related protein